MADEITMAVTLLMAKSGKRVSWNKGATQDDMSGTDYNIRTQIVGNSEEALGLGEVSSLGWMVGRNNDATNSVYLRSGTGGTDLIEFPPGGHVLLFKFKSTVTAPFVISSAGTPELEYALIER